MITLLGAPLEFYLFGLTLLGVAVFHRRTLEVALVGLAAILLYQGFVGAFPTGAVCPLWPSTSPTSG